MALETRSFTVTTPAGTLKTALLNTALTMPNRVIRGLAIRVPPGPNGELGFQIGMVGQAVIPVNSAEFIVTADEIINWDFQTPLTTGAWQCISYNTGRYDHTIQVRFYCDLVGTDIDTAGVSPIPASQLDQQALVTPADIGIPVDEG